LKQTLKIWIKKFIKKNIIIETSVKVRDKKNITINIIIGTSVTVIDKIYHNKYNI
jgi:hypothetical protein